MAVASYLRAFNFPIDHVPSHSKTDLNLSYTDPTGNWNVSAFADNVENRAVRNMGFTVLGTYFSDYNPRAHSAFGWGTIIRMPGRKPDSARVPRARQTYRIPGSSANSLVSTRTMSRVVAALSEYFFWSRRDSRARRVTLIGPLSFNSQGLPRVGIV